MKITRCECFQYQLPLHKPLVVGSETFAKREGVVLTLYDEKNNLGVGEIAPLPGLSKETLGEARQQILNLAQTIINHSPPVNGHGTLNDALKTWLQTFRLVPSARFGFEMAFLNLLASRRNVFLRDIIVPTEHAQVPICGLLPGPVQDPLREAEEMIQKGMRVVKLKVGRSGLDEDIKMIQAVNQRIEGKAVLRLDANQKWDLNKAVLLGHEIGCAAVEYIEEPFQNSSQYEEFFMKTTIPVALDETVLKLDFNQIKSLSGVDFLIIKPTILGGIVKTWDLMSQCQRVGLQTVISSSFESSLGLSALVNLAACDRIGHACGLDTLKWFKEDIMKTPPVISHGALNVNKPVKSMDELDRLHKVE